MNTECSTAAIEFALNNHADGGMEFLRCWFNGDFEAIRKEWPEAPEAVFVGADPLHPKAAQAADALAFTAEA